VKTKSISSLTNDYIKIKPSGFISNVKIEIVENAESIADHDFRDITIKNRCSITKI